MVQARRRGGRRREVDGDAAAAEDGGGGGWLVWGRYEAGESKYGPDLVGLWAVKPCGLMRGARSEWFNFNRLKS